MGGGWSKSKSKLLQSDASTKKKSGEASDSTEVRPSEPASPAVVVSGSKGSPEPTQHTQTSDEPLNEQKRGNSDDSSSDDDEEEEDQDQEPISPLPKVDSANPVKRSRRASVSAESMDPAKLKAQQSNVRKLLKAPDVQAKLLSILTSPLLRDLEVDQKSQVVDAFDGQYPILMVKI